MSAGWFALYLLLALLVFAAVPMAHAHQAGTLHRADWALIFVPAPTFVAALLAMNDLAKTGWAVMVYPFLVLALSVVALWIRVFLLPRFGVPSRAASSIAFAAAVLAAALFGTFVPPLYE